MVIPSSQGLDASAGEQLLAIAFNDRGLLESFPEHCAVLPPSAVRVLDRAGAPIRCLRPGWPRNSRGPGQAGADGPGAVRGAAVLAGWDRGRAGPVAGGRQVRPRARLRR